jgi:hypothetical protein
VSARWSIPLASPTEIRVPGGGLPPTAGRRAETFVRDRDYSDTRYGQDFIDWYNQSLVDHGRRLLIAADAAFSGPFQSIPLGMKIPGVHWQMMSCAAHPRIAEITAGLVQTTLDLRPVEQARGDAYGYKRIVDMVADVSSRTGRDVVLHFTAAEMDNDSACGTSNSMAEALVFWIAQAAARSWRSGEKRERTRLREPAWGRPHLGEYSQCVRQQHLPGFHSAPSGRERLQPMGYRSGRLRILHQGLRHASPMTGTDVAECLEVHFLRQSP